MKRESRVRMVSSNRKYRWLSKSKCYLKRRQRKRRRKRGNRSKIHLLTILEYQNIRPLVRSILWLTQRSYWKVVREKWYLLINLLGKCHHRWRKHLEVASEKRVRVAARRSQRLEISAIYNKVKKKELKVKISSEESKCKRLVSRKVNLLKKFRKSKMTPVQVMIRRSHSFGARRMSMIYFQITWRKP